jgi:hypothetical protein
VTCLVQTIFYLGVKRAMHQLFSSPLYCQARAEFFAAGRPSSVYQSKEAARIDQETDGKYVHKEQTVLLQLSSDGAQVFTFATWGTWFIWVRSVFVLCIVQQYTYGCIFSAFQPASFVGGQSVVPLMHASRRSPENELASGVKTSLTA